MDDFVNIVDKLLPAKNTLESVTFSGGEPFLNKKLPGMCKHIASLIRKPKIFTSGISPLLNNGVKLEDFYEYVEALNVSIKYPDGENNDDWFGKDGISEAAEEFISDARDMGLEVNLHFCIDRSNFIYFNDMRTLASSFGSRLHVLRYLPFNRTAREFQIAMNDKEWENFALSIKDVPNVSLVYYPNDRKVVCVAGLTRINIFPDGSVTPCIYINDKELRDRWNILEDYLVDILYDMREWREKFGEMPGCLGIRRV